MKSFGDMIRPTLRKRGLQLLRTPDLGDFLRHRDCDLVLDVGANVGQFAMNLRELGYRGPIISFEPQDACYARLQELSAADPLWTLSHKAVGAEPGTTTINISRTSAYSSILPLSEKGAAYAAGTEIVAHQETPVTTIDLAMVGVSAERPFLKIDTQGFEPEVLAGAGETLKRCVGVLLELPVDELYQRSWSFSEAIAQMEKLGFVPAQFLSVSPRWAFGDPVSAVEFDCLFRRADFGAPVNRLDGQKLEP